MLSTYVFKFSNIQEDLCDQNNGMILIRCASVGRYQRIIDRPNSAPVVCQIVVNCRDLLRLQTQSITSIAIQVLIAILSTARNAKFLEIQKRAFSRVGAKIWNEMPASLRELPKKHLQTKLHSFLFDILKKHDDYIGISKITSALKMNN